MELLKITTKNLASSIEGIANELMNQYLLQVNNQRYRIAELEFYVHNADHPDPYVHGHDLQQTVGQWYFHGSGIDITFGDKNFHGGILLRALMKWPDEDQYIYGPLNLLTEIFACFGTVKAQAVNFGLIASDLEKEIVYPAPRVGLSDKSPKFKQRLYRFFIYPKQKHADKSKIVEAIGDRYPDINEVIWG